MRVDQFRRGWVALQGFADGFPCGGFLAKIKLPEARPGEACGVVGVRLGREALALRPLVQPTYASLAIGKVGRAQCGQVACVGFPAHLRGPRVRRCQDSEFPQFDGQRLSNALMPSYRRVHMVHVPVEARQAVRALRRQEFAGVHERSMGLGRDAKEALFDRGDDPQRADVAILGFQEVRRGLGGAAQAIEQTGDPEIQQRVLAVDGGGLPVKVQSAGGVDLLGRRGEVERRLPVGFRFRRQARPVLGLERRAVAQVGTQTYQYEWDAGGAAVGDDGAHRGVIVCDHAFVPGGVPMVGRVTAGVIEPGIDGGAERFVGCRVGAG